MVVSGTDKPPEIQPKARPSSSPLVFISHDSRDGDLAEAFSKLLRSVSAGMLKSFNSSDKKGSEGIEFGDEWYKRLMSKLDAASDVVCLLTERSLERPWILYEAGVAKGKLSTPVFGVALGIPLASVNAGPFYQFQNCDDTADSLQKLVMQLASRVPALEPDPDVVSAQVEAFKTHVDEILAQLSEPGASEQETPSEASTAKLFEELKVIVRDLPSRIDEELSCSPGSDRRRRVRRFHPAMMDEFAHILPGGPADPTFILLLTSVFKDDIPWLYEMGRDACDALRGRNRQRRERAIRALYRGIEFVTHGPVYRECLDSDEAHMALHHVMRFLEDWQARLIDGDDEH